jgi:chemotaxis protein methyltransferase CheR
VLCRNVLIYFKQQLKERVLELFDSCLTPGGFLCLGTKEALDGRSVAHRYQELSPHIRIYRKRYV